MDNNISDLEKINKQEIEDKNKELIEIARQNSNKPKHNNKKLFTILWIVIFAIFVIGVIVAIWLATRPIEDDPQTTTINISITSDDPAKNEQVLGSLKYPKDRVDYTLYVKNDKSSYDAVYIRFYALTYLEGVKTDYNIITLINNSDNFFYDEVYDCYYYKSKLNQDHKIQICSEIELSSQTGNEYANKSISFTITVETVRASYNEFWPDAPTEWLEHVTSQQ